MRADLKPEYCWLICQEGRQLFQSAGLLCQRMDDHRTGHRGGWADEQGCKVLLDPGEGTPVRLLRSRVIVEEADCRYSVVGCINHIVCHEAFNITDDRNGALLDSARELFGHASLGFTLTNGGVHGTLLHRRGCPRSRLRRSSVTPRRGEQQDSPRTECYAIRRNRTIGEGDLSRWRLPAGAFSASPEHFWGVRY